MELFLLIIAIAAATGASWVVLDLIDLVRRRRVADPPRRSRPRVTSMRAGREVRS